MPFLYNLLVQLTWYALHLVALFSPKIKLFVEGRKQTLAILQKKLDPQKNTIWIHVASLGEFEQGLPVMERLKKEYVDHQLVVTFFSPSGYEVRKNTPIADAVAYLPMDTKGKVDAFLDLVRPKIAVFVKYEIWPNYMQALERRNVPTVLISAIFNPNQVYFKPYGGFMRKALGRFVHIFVQDEASQKLLASLDLHNTSVSGDTRFDRVAEILERDNTMPIVAQFKQDQLCLVAGSTWPEDELLLAAHINTSTQGTKYILAPHKIQQEQLVKLQGQLSKKSALLSQVSMEDAIDYEVLLVDSIGQLTKIYSYADLAYVGGGFATGLHNTLEPAVFGIPVVIGPKYHGFKEAEELVALGGALSVASVAEGTAILERLENDPEFRAQCGNINRTYTQENKGASIQIVDYLRRLL